MFDRVARRRPDLVALRAGAEVSYGDLLARADRLAGRLRKAGVGPETAVAVALDRGVDQIAALLAVWKAGGGYVAVDPSWPDERVRWVVEDSGALVIVARAPPSGLGALWIDPAAPHGSLEGGAPVAPRPDDLAYVVYTSGSTGRPKGVEVTHANLLNFVAWRWRAMEIVPRDRSSHLASVAFDAAVAEVWPHLSAGASVAIAPAGVVTSPARLQDWLLREGVTLATFVPPTLAQHLIKADWPRPCALRLLMSAGEALHAYPAPDLPLHRDERLRPGGGHGGDDHRGRDRRHAVGRAAVHRTRYRRGGGAAPG